ncbi:MAG: alkaline metalloproteinase, partial [Proteobacteria bacterium]|nr:alkaline metalloproteinase [Pseudomonadota bacterium]
GAGNDTLDGGTGIDTVLYSNDSSKYAVTKTATGYVVKDNAGTEGIDELDNVERVAFSDHAIALTMEGVNAGILPPHIN